MESMKARTPTPWTKDGYSDLRGADGELVTVWGLGIGFSNRFPDTEANSAFILYAVNNIERLEKVNEALVRALERLVEMREIHERIYGMEKQHYIISDNEDWAAGRAALALAKEPA